MPVTFRTQAVIDAAKEALVGHAKADTEYQRDLEAYKARRLAEQDMLPELRALRDELTAFLKKNRQPVREDAMRFKRAVREDYLRNLYVGGVSDSDIRNNVSKPLGWLNATTVGEYQGLIKMLKAHTEPTISANQLKLFGYTRLEPLFRLAALASPVTDA